jgi:cell division transport system permease protein
MIRQLLHTPAPDLPLRQDGSGRFLPWIIGLMVYLCALGGWGLILLGDTLGDWTRDLTTTLTVQLPPGTQSGRMDAVLAELRATKGVISAQPLDAAEMSRLLEPWLGKSVPIETLPLPRLIDVQIDPGAAIDVANLQQKLGTIAPGAQLDNHRLWLDRLRGLAVRAEIVIAAIVAIVAVIAVLAVVFVARTGLAMHHSVIELLHLLGAADQDIAGRFQLHAGWLGLHGGAIGAVAAAVTAFLLGSAAKALQLPMRIAPHGIADVRLWLLLVLLPPAAAGVAAVTARVTVLRSLARPP